VRATRQTVRPLTVRGCRGDDRAGGGRDLFPRRGAVRFNGRPLGVWAAPATAVYLLSAMRIGGAQFIIDKWSPPPRPAPYAAGPDRVGVKRICHSRSFYTAPLPYVFAPPANLYYGTAPTRIIYMYIHETYTLTFTIIYYCALLVSGNVIYADK